MKYSLLPLSLLLFFIASCKKETPNTSTNNTNDANQLAQIFATQQSAIQTFTINSLTGGAFTSAKGARVVIPDNAFVSSTGLPITGAVTVQFTEYLKPSDMIFSKILPVSNGDPLISGGEFKLEAVQNNVPVFLNATKNIEVNLPLFGAATPNLEVFFGNLNQTLVPDPMNLINWNLAQKDSGTNFLVYNGDTVKLFTDSINTYCNADKFMTNPNYQTFTIHLTGANITSDNTTAYVVYDDYLGVWPLYGCTTATFSESHVPNIPVHLVVFGIYNGVFKAGTLALTPSNGNTYTVNLSTTTPQDLKAEIDNF